MLAVSGAGFSKLNRARLVRRYEHATSGERMVIPRQDELYFPGSRRKAERTAARDKLLSFFVCFFLRGLRDFSGEHGRACWDCRVTRRYTKIVFRAAPRPDFQCSLRSFFGPEEIRREL